MANAKSNITVIGGGPGGYVAAIRAAQLGAQVTLIEEDTLGGTCLNRGCIPTKVLLHSAGVFSLVKNAGTFGVSAEKVSLDFSAVVRRKETVVKQLVGGVTSLMRKNKIRVIKGTGTIIGPKAVGIVDTGEEIKSDNIIIATGARPSRVPIKGIDEPGVITSDEALSMERLPQSIVVIGGGVIGLELAQIFHKMGSKVTILEMMSQILPAEDAEIAGVLEDIMKQDGMEIFTSATVTHIESTGQGEKMVLFDTEEGSQKKVAEKVLVAVGRYPNTDNLGLEKLDIALDRGRIVVNERMETKIPGVYAIGDVVGGYMLAHVAMDEGKCAVENALGQAAKVDYRAVPRCVYTSPEIAGLGLTEAEARREYENVRVGRFPFIANGRALTLNRTKGMVKIIADTRYGQILGAHILGYAATELIAEVALTMQLEATFGDLASVIHAHPTLSEAVMEAALGVEGRSIHF